MKPFLIAVFAAMCTFACGSSPSPDCPDCPPTVDCPTPAPCPDPNCPTPAPCPDPNCPTPPPCPDCPPCDPNVVCPQPPVPPIYPEIAIDANQFQFTAVLAAPQTLGLYVVDPNGQYHSAVFAMPELHQKLEFEETLVLQTSTGNGDGTSSTEIGNIEGADDPYGLIVASLCEDEFADQCTALVITKNDQIIGLNVQLLVDSQQSFNWSAED